MYSGDQSNSMQFKIKHFIKCLFFCGKKETQEDHIN